MNVPHNLDHLSKLRLLKVISLIFIFALKIHFYFPILAMKWAPKLSFKVRVHEMCSSQYNFVQKVIQKRLNLEFLKKKEFCATYKWNILGAMIYKWIFNWYLNVTFIYIYIHIRKYFEILELGMSFGDFKNLYEYFRNI